MALKSLVQIAEAEVGVREVGGNNCGKEVRMFQAATNLKPGAWPWCAAFVDWCVQQLLAQPEYQHLAPKDRPKTPAAFGLLEWAKAEGLPTPTPDDYHPKPGDIVVYEFSHCGIVTGYQPGTITTIEGNTNGKGERDSTAGDGVWRKTRHTSLVRRYIKMPLLLLFAALLALSGCAAPDVRLTNGCVIVAANREAVLDADHALDPRYWRSLIMIQYKDRPQLGHCYLYYELGDSAQAYDEGGTRWLIARSRNPQIIGQQLAGAKLLSASWIRPSVLADPTPAR